MKESYWGYWIILLGLFVVGIMLLVNNVSTTSTKDYYDLKEITQSSMIDALDLSYYRLYGTIKISEHKFVESFARRFAENKTDAGTYDIDFYDLHEVPPKVSVKISTATRKFTVGKDTSGFDVVTTISQILELNPDYGEGDGRTPVPNEEYVCKVSILRGLMDYLKGKEVDGYKIGSDSFSVQGRYNKSEVDSIDNITDFTYWFAKNYRIENQSCEDYLYSGVTKDQFPSDLKAYIDRKWIIIED